MKAKALIGLLAVMAVCSCSEKKQAEALQPVKVKTMTAGMSNASNGQSYTGTVEEMNGVALSFTVGGTLRQLLVDEGQMVAKGQLIAVTDGQDQRNLLETSQANVQNAKAAYNQALDAYKRMKMIHDQGSLSDIKWVEAQSNLERAKSAVEAAQAQSRIASKSVGDTRLYAPFGGYISKKNVEIGQTIAPGAPVVNLVRIDNVKVKISVPEEDVAGIKVGMPLWASISALGNRTFKGKVTEKNVSADPMSRSYEVKAVIANPKHELLPGMIAEASLPLTPSDRRGSSIPKNDGIASPSPTGEGWAGASSIALPAGIIQLDADNRTFVWTVKNGKAKKTYVSTGDNIGDKVAVTGGLQYGDKVIIEGQQKVSEGMAVAPPTR